MKFSLGMLCGFILGAIVATTWPTFAQLAPFDAPLDQQLDAQRAESYLKIERELDHLRHDRLDPCRR